MGLNADGSFTYTPTVDYIGWDQFTYFAFDGIAQSSITTATIARNGVVMERSVWNSATEKWVWEARGEGIEERWVGEYVLVRAKAVGPIPPTITSHSWSAQGDYVRDYLVEDQEGRYGRVRNHTSEQYALDGFWLYWHESSGAGTFSVTDTITLQNGPQVAKSAKYAVMSPSFSVGITDNTNSITFEPNILATHYRHGDANPAVEFDATQTTGPAGQHDWLQLIDWETRAYFDQDPGTFADPSAGPGDYILTFMGLDAAAGLPDPFTDPPKASIPNLAGPTGVITQDTHFKTYLMWKSPRIGSIPVSLRRVDWSFEFWAVAVEDPSIPAGWSWGPAGGNDSFVGDAVEETLFPEWEARVSEGLTTVFHSNGLEETVIWRPLM